MAEVDFIEEIHIAQYWRKQLGEYEYVHYNADDLRRWYIALETRGPEEIRSYLTERDGRFPPGAITGIVALAPHPPLPIVELWLASHDKTPTRPYWITAALFGLTTVFFVPYLHSCANLPNNNRVATHPPQINAPIQAGNAGPPQQATSTLPNPGTPPASVASPTATPPATGHR